MKLMLCFLVLLGVPVSLLLTPLDGGRDCDRERLARSGIPAPPPAVTVEAPEIDPAAMSGALVLLTVGTLILTDRRRAASRDV